MVLLRYLQYAKDLKAQGKGRAHFLQSRVDLDVAIAEMTIALNSPWIWLKDKTRYYEINRDTAGPAVCRRVAFFTGA